MRSTIQGERMENRNEGDELKSAKQLEIQKVNLKNANSKIHWK